MELNYIKIIETLVVLSIYIISRISLGKIIDKTLVNRLLSGKRGVEIRRTINITLLLLCLIFVLIIWGVKQAELAVFMGSVLTVVGVAMFAQWSLLSNITSSIIIFFYHSVKLNDSIIIMEGKDYIIEGEVINIGLFFITLETDDSEEITLPNNIFIQKSIKKKS